MEYGRSSRREQARARLAQIDREIADILRVFPDLRVRRSAAGRRSRVRPATRATVATWRRPD